MYSLILKFFGYNTSPAVPLLRTSFIFLALVCFAPHRTLAVNPAPDGGYANGNTAEGNNALLNLTTGGNNTAIGFQALKTLTTGQSNTGIGFQALLFNTGNANTGTGFDALLHNSRGINNTATGSQALSTNNVGNGNTATGQATLFNNRNGNNNTATGVQALNRNQSGSNNTATGVNALLNNTASNNTATGADALFSNTVGTDNTAEGYLALHDNVGDLAHGLGLRNTAMGSQALQHNTGTWNTAVGYLALQSNTTGMGNTAVGAGALFEAKGQVNTAIGNSALSGAFGQENIGIGDTALAFVQGDNNVAIGRAALAEAGTANSNLAVGDGAGENLLSGDHNIYIGSVGDPSASIFAPAPESDTIRIGESTIQTATFIAGIYGQSVDAASGVPVQIDSTGKLGTVLSSARFKQAIKPMDKVSEAVLGLQPVTFQYKPELDPKGVPQFGLVAEQVEKVAPQLVVHDKQGKPYTVRYEAVNAMLLNEFLKEHRNVAEQQSTIAELKTTVAQQQKQIETLTATVQKVSDQVALSKPVPQLVANP